MSEPELSRLTTLLEEASKIAASLQSFDVSPMKMLQTANNSNSNSSNDNNNNNNNQAENETSVPFKDALEYLKKATINRKLQQMAKEKPMFASGHLMSPGRSRGRVRASTISSSSPPAFGRALQREKLDIDSPLEKVIKILKKLRVSLLDGNDIAGIDYVLRVVVSNELYRPNLDLLQENNNVQMDSETKEWLERDYLLKADQKRTIGALPGTNSLRNLLLNSGNFDNKLVIPSKENNPEISALFQTFDLWGFDIFKLSEKCGGRPLYYVGFAVFKRLGLIERWGIDEIALTNFLSNIEAGYVKDNPYHNSVHAADVTQAAYHFLISGLSEQLADTEVFALVVAAIIHDFQHPGLTNAFQVKTESKHAILYNDKSVLENFHLASAFTLLQKKENNILASLTKEERADFREAVIAMVLATDMTVHFDRVTQFKTKLATGIDTTKKEDRSIVLQMAIKCADISAQARPVELGLKWSSNVAEEFFRRATKKKF